MNNDENKLIIELVKPIASKIIEGATKTRTLFSSPCIFRVPEDLRKLNKSAYEPSLIAIGPLHRKDKHLQTPMQHVKMHYTNMLLYPLAKDDNREMLGRKKGVVVLLNCVEEMKKCVERAKKCYAEEVPLAEKEEGKDMNVIGGKRVEKQKKEKVEKKMKETAEEEKEMVEMMVVDGCFILNLLYSSYRRKKKKELEKETEEKETEDGCFILNLLCGDGGNSKASSSSPQPTHGGIKSSRYHGGLEDPLLENDLLRLENQLCQASSSSPHRTHGGEDASKSSSESSDDDGKVDPILDCRINESIVKHDLLLLENQIPFFVLEKLFETIPLDQITEGKNPSLTDLVVDFFQDIICRDGDDHRKVTNEKNCPQENGSYYHILHFLHEHYIPRPPKPKPTGNKLTDIVCASDLYNYAGVKFVPSKGNLFDVQFKEPKWPLRWFQPATFQIPTLDIHDTAETLFRNLIALEQCCPNVDLHFVTDYAKFIDMLIDSEEDVKLLTKAKVIRNHLGAHVDASDLVNKLCKHIVMPKDFYYNDMCEAANKYSQRCSPKIWAFVRRTYIDSPWRSVGFFVAFIVFAITVWEFIIELP